MNTNYTPSTVVTALRTALNARNDVKPSKNIDDALKTLSLFPTETGAGLIKLCDTIGLDLDQQIRIIATADKRKGMKNDPLFINVKALHKLFCLCQWIMGVTDEAAHNADKAVSRGKCREGVMDNFVRRLIDDIFDAYSVKGSFGQLKAAPAFSGHDLKCGISYNWAADRKTLPEQADAERQRYFDMGSGDYSLGTAGTQGSQIKTMLISFGMVDPEAAIKRDELKFNVEFAKLIAKTKKLNKISGFDNARK